jgi:hypothetical protein
MMDGRPLYTSRAGNIAGRLKTWTGNMIREQKWNEGEGEDEVVVEDAGRLKL